jgi:hypothetical protein
MKSQKVETCGISSCHWEEEQENIPRLQMLNSSAFASTVLWGRAVQRIRDYGSETELPPPRLALDFIELKTLNNKCCRTCHSELKTLFRIGRQVAEARSILSAE